jgi:hypothetical protein
MGRICELGGSIPSENFGEYFEVILMNALDREVLAITLMHSEELNKVSPQFHIWFETRTDRNLGQNSCESALFESFKTLGRDETDPSVSGR